MDSPAGTESKPQVVFLEFESRQEASRALADEIASTLAKALDQRQEATLVVSGGTSPVTFFHNLRDRELAWDQMTIIPSDERNVPAGHADRNDAMIQRELMQGAASSAHLRRLLPRSVADRIPQVFDGVVLGMGEDGHTASLFPDSTTIEADLDSTELTVHVFVPRLEAERTSLTPVALLNSRRIDLLFFGEAKRSVFEKARLPGPISTFPVRAVLHQDRVPVRVFWAP